jgi:hypothetical protein
VPNQSCPDPGDGQPLADATSVLERVRTAFRAAIEEVPGPNTRPIQLEHSLGLHKTLAWKLASLSELDEVISAHAGDRETFGLMLAGVSPDRQKDEALQYRKEGFRGTSHVWGVQAETIVRTVILHPSAESPMLDAAALFGCIDFRRLRTDRPWVLNRWRPTDDAGAPIPVTREPIRAGSAGGTPLLAGCSTIGPGDVRRTLLDDGTTEDELLDGPVGKTGAATCFFGEVVRSVMSRYRAEGNVSYAQNLDLRTPCRTVIFDHLVPRSLFGAVQPRARVFGELAGRPLYSTVRSNRDRLEIFEEVEHLGAGVAALATDDIPDYGDIVASACEALGWDVAGCDVYRLRIPYPYVPSTLTYSYPLPEAPA